MDEAPLAAPDAEGPGLHPDVERILKQIMAYDPERVVLFGSAARGDMAEGSDIDLIIVKETDRRFLDRLADVFELLDIAPVDALVYTQAELDRLVAEGNDFITTALDEGVVIYERRGGTSAGRS